MCESRTSVGTFVSGSNTSDGALTGIGFGFAGGLGFPTANDPGAGAGGTLGLVAGGSDVGSFGVGGGFGAGGFGAGGFAYGALGTDDALHECEGCDHEDARADVASRV